MRDREQTKRQLTNLLDPKRDRIELRLRCLPVLIPVCVQNKNVSYGECMGVLYGFYNMRKDDNFYCVIAFVLKCL